MRVKKRVLGSLFLVLILCSVAGAECVATGKSIMYFEPTRFATVAQVCAVNQQQGLAMMIDDVTAGKAVFVETGTRFDAAVPLPENDKVVVCRIGKVLMIGLADFVKCR